MMGLRLRDGTGTERWVQILVVGLGWRAGPAPRAGPLTDCRENQANPQNPAAPAGARWHPALLFKGPQGLGLGLLLAEDGAVLVGVGV